MLGSPSNTERDYHVLRNLGACDIAVFIDMPHHEHRDALTLAQLHRPAMVQSFT